MSQYNTIKGIKICKREIYFRNTNFKIIIWNNKLYTAINIKTYAVHKLLEIDSNQFQVDYSKEKNENFNNIEEKDTD